MLATNGEQGEPIAAPFPTFLNAHPSRQDEPFQSKICTCYTKFFKVQNVHNIDLRHSRMK